MPMRWVLGAAAWPRPDAGRFHRSRVQLVPRLHKAIARSTICLAAQSVAIAVAANCRFDVAMPALTRRCDPDAALIHYGDVRIGVIAQRIGNPNHTPPWQWACGFYSGSHPRECTQAHNVGCGLPIADAGCGRMVTTLLWRGDRHRRHGHTLHCAHRMRRSFTPT